MTVSEFDNVVVLFPKRKKPVRREWLLKMAASFSVVMLCVLALIMLLAGCATKPGMDYSPGAEETPVSPEAEAQLGIRLQGLRLSAAGYILDFRYRVVDPARAMPLLDGKIRPYLLDEASGAQLGVPDTAKLGQLRTKGRNKVVSDQDYFILFANPGRFVQSGTRMTLVMGDLRIGNLVVR